MLISEFYNNQILLVTGGSGFIGKALVEKLLRSCPGISKIYFLIREKNGKSAQERLEDTLQDPCFRQLWQERPEVLKRIEAIKGDCTELQLGIAPQDLDRISDVSIIIHSAATVRFDEPMRQAIFMNTRCTHELLKIALNLRNLIAVLHVSTTYCNPAETKVYEKVYEPVVDWRDAIKIAENFDAETLDIFSSKIASKHPNTYTFTKNLGEKIMEEYKDRLPISILRPSIVVSSIAEPIPGWVDNINGPIGLLIACGIGIKRSDLCDPNVILAVVPVDIVVRSIIVAAYKTGMESKSLITERNQPIPYVYNCALDRTAPITLGKLIRTGERHVQDIPFEKTVWLPGGVMSPIKLLYLFQVVVLQVPFSIVIDGLLSYSGKKPVAMKLQRILVNASKALHHFMFNNWDFRTENFFELEKLVSKQEKGEFGFLEICYIDYEKYFPNLIRGMREFILKEPREPSSAAMKRIKAFKVLHKLIKGIFVFSVLYWFYRCLIL